MGWLIYMAIGGTVCGVMVAVVNGLKLIEKDEERKKKNAEKEAVETRR